MGVESVSVEVALAHVDTLGISFDSPTTPSIQVSM